jgi:hypothetical protein
MVHAPRCGALALDLVTYDANLAEFVKVNQCIKVVVVPLVLWYVAK